MRWISRCLSIAALAFVPCGAAPVLAGQDCKQTALEHLRASPDGIAVYASIGRPDFFEGWIDCEDAQFDLSTAVHESTHYISSETDAFPLVGGGSVERPHEVSGFYPPADIASKIAASDYAKIYLRRGKASSSTDFLYLLDELNAYSHDLQTAVDLRDLAKPDEAVDHRDGLAAMMAFVATYAETARASRPATWTGLRKPTVARVISALWDRAERVMASSCGIPNFGNDDKTYIREFCSAAARSALEPILGRPPVCPTNCLSPDIERTSSDEVAVAIAPFHSISRRRAYRQ